MDHFWGKMTVSIMKKRLPLELKIDPEKVKDQLKARVEPDDEVSNFTIALMTQRDPRLCGTDKTRFLSFFFRTYFMDNLVKKDYSLIPGSFIVTMYGFGLKIRIYLDTIKFLFPFTLQAVKTYSDF